MVEKSWHYRCFNFRGTFVSISTIYEIFDGRFVFSLFDKMVHFKEQSTLWEDSFKASDELCRTKDVQILDLVHRVTGLEKIIVETEKIIVQKDQLIKGQCSKFIVVRAESIFDLADRLKDMYQAQRKKDEETIGRLENELKNRPKVLNMPPLKTVFGKEAELQQELKQKETFIPGLKVEFQRALREMIIKQQNETAEYETRLEKLNKTIKKNELLKKRELKGFQQLSRLKVLEEEKNQQ